MKNKWFSYIKINAEENNIVSSGISFNDFFEGIQNKPKNLLILKGYPMNAEFSNNLCLEYIPSNQIEMFSKTDVYDYGDFYWVDFENLDNLQNVSDAELAELLYLSHKAKPLKDFHFDCIQNQYAYCSHDDDWSVKIHFNDTSKYMDVIEYKILKKLKGRKRTISALPQGITNKLYALFKYGAIIDFENSYLSGVRIYSIGNIQDMDSIHRKLDKLRAQLQGHCLDYNTDTKKWTLYENEGNKSW